MDSKTTEFLANPPKHINPPIPTVAHGIHFNTWLQQNPVRAKRKKEEMVFRSGGLPKPCSSFEHFDVAFKVVLQRGRATPPVEADMNEGKERRTSCFTSLQGPKAPNCFKNVDHLT